MLVLWVEEYQVQSTERLTEQRADDSVLSTEYGITSMGRSTELKATTRYCVLGTHYRCQR